MNTRIYVDQYGSFVFEEDLVIKSLALPVFDVIEIDEEIEDVDYYLADAFAGGELYDIFGENEELA